MYKRTKYKYKEDVESEDSISAIIILAVIVMIGLIAISIFVNCKNIKHKKPVQYTYYCLDDRIYYKTNKDPIIKIYQVNSGKSSSSISCADFIIKDIKGKSGN